jgi:ribonuclease VapC
MSFVLDASAVLALLLKEPGGALVQENLQGSQISVVNLGEVCSTLMDHGMSFELAQEIINPLPIRVRTFREAHAWKVAQLRPLTKSFGLSFGDRACITQAMFDDLPILTSDRRMTEARVALNLDIRMIR